LLSQICKTVNIVIFVHTNKTEIVQTSHVSQAKDTEIRKGGKEISVIVLVVIFGQGGLGFCPPLCVLVYVNMLKVFIHNAAVVLQLLYRPNNRK